MSLMSGEIVTAASEQWFKRPDDQRFLTIDELRASVASLVAMIPGPPRRFRARSRRW